MADQPLSSATYHHLGRPLPHQQVNTPQAHPKATAKAVFYMNIMRCSWLCGISTCFQVLSPSFGQVAYVLLTRSPLDLGKQAFLPLVRLACIRHAASVHPEPGSNSPSNMMAGRVRPVAIMVGAGCPSRPASRCVGFHSMR